MRLVTSRAPLTLTLCCLVGLAIAPAVSGKQSSSPSQIITPEQREILGHLSIAYLDDGLGGTVKTVRLSGTNL
jgi:hypothetical protein